MYISWIGYLASFSIVGMSGVVAALCRTTDNNCQLYRTACSYAPGLKQQTKKTRLFGGPFLVKRLD